LLAVVERRRRTGSRQRRSDPPAASSCASSPSRQSAAGVSPRRSPSVAAHAILRTSAASTTGDVFIDDEGLAKAGVTDLAKYSVVPGSKQLLPDLFL
jgi:hypothetical protein